MEQKHFGGKPIVKYRIHEKSEYEVVFWPELDEAEPKGDQLDELAERFPAPPEWYDEDGE